MKRYARHIQYSCTIANLQLCPEVKFKDKSKSTCAIEKFQLQIVWNYKMYLYVHMVR